MSDEFRVPEVGEVVRYTNRHGFPRAAIITGTMDSLEGELHVPLIHDPNVVHLTVLSPIRTYLEFGVLFSEHGDDETWQYQPARIASSS